MKHFSFRPAISMSGRENIGLRGLEGKPFHPPLTDIPVAAYLFAALFDLISMIMGMNSSSNLARELFTAGSWVVTVGVLVSFLAALTGWADWHRSSEPGNQARRTINSHAIIMLSVTAVAILDAVLRLTVFQGSSSTPIIIFILSAFTAIFVSLGATYGGSLVFDYGFNVETAGDHPVWHNSEVDVFHKKSEN